MDDRSTVFSFESLVPFHYVDLAGILFFAHAFTLANLTLEHFVIEKLGMEWSDWFANPEWVAPIKESKAIFFKPILGGKLCEIKLSIEGMSNSALIVQYDFYQSGAHCCKANIVYVFCSKGHNLQKRAIPPVVAQKIQSLLKA